MGWDGCMSVHSYFILWHLREYAVVTNIGGRLGAFIVGLYCMNCQGPEYLCPVCPLTVYYGILETTERLPAYTFVNKEPILKELSAN